MNHTEFQGEVKGAQVGDHNIIYNYFYYREEVKPTSVDLADEYLPCPYRGLFHFGPNDADVFFGREIFIEELYSATKTHNFIPVLGASGSGKSSVVLAGLVPKLQKEGHWQFTHFRPGADPFHALALAIVPLYTPNLDETDQIAQARKMAGYLQDGSVILSDVFARIQQNHPNHRVLLIADQFEEIYTLCNNQEIRRKFLDCILASLVTPTSLSSSAMVLVTTMRADFLGNALSYRPFADVLQNADLKLGPMNREELTQVIEKPAQKLGVTFETGLVERILHDVENQPGNLPLLEFALTELWNKRTGKQLTHKIYEEIGQVEGALARHADEKYGNLTDEEKEKVRRIFIQLVRPGEGAEDTRRIATKAELGEASWELVKQLADNRLVVTNRNAADQETVEIVHEALIRNWGEFRQWMDKDRSFRAWQERLRVVKVQWEATNKDEQALLRGAALAEAGEKLKQRREDLSAEEQEFIQASVALRDKEHQQRERARRLTFSGLAGGLVLALGLSGFAWWQWQRSERLRLTSEIERIAVTALNQFETGGAEVESLLLALQSGQKLQNVFKNNQVFQNYPTVRPRFVLEKILDNIREQNRLNGHQGKVMDITFSPDGKQIASVGEDSTLRLWNFSGQQTSQFEVGKTEKVNFTPDGQRLVTFGEKIKIWDLSGQQIAQFDNNKQNIIFSLDGQDITVVKDRNNNISILNVSEQQLAQSNFSSKINSIESIILSPNGHYLAILEDKNTISLWNLFGKQLTQLKTEYGIRILAISPDGKYIAVKILEDKNNNVRILDLSGQNIAQFNYGDYTSHLIFSPDGEYIAGEGEDGKVRLWNLSGEQIAILDALNGSIMAPGSGRIELVSFSPNSQYIVTIGMGDEALLWNLSGQKLAVLNTKNSILDVSFSPDSQNLITAGSNGKIGFWNLSYSQIAHFKEAFDGRRGLSKGVGFSPNGKYIATQDYEKKILLWNQFGKQIAKFSIVLDSPQELSVTPDGKYIFGFDSVDKYLKLWNLEGQQIKQWDAIEDMSVSPNGKYLAIKQQDIIQIWDLSGNKISDFHAGHFDNLKFSVDGQYIFTHSLENGNLILWDLEGKQIAQWDKIKTSSFIKGKKYIAIQKENYIVEVWDFSKKTITQVDSFNLDAEAIFSPDGKYVARKKQDQIEIWTLFGEKISQFYIGSDDSINFSPDGQQIVTGEGYKIRLWTVLGQQLAEFDSFFQTRHSFVSNVSFSPNGQYIFIETGGHYINLLLRIERLDELVDKGCKWLNDYLIAHPDEGKELKVCENQT